MYYTVFMFLSCVYYNWCIYKCKKILSKAVSYIPLKHLSSAHFGGIETYGTYETKK